MSNLKKVLATNVLIAAKERIAFTFDNFKKIYISFSGGKDSTVLFHLVLQEAIKRNRKVGVLIIDLEAQYKITMKHVEDCFEKYKEHIDLYWICLPIALRNAVSNFEPRWQCWDPNRQKDWVRELPTRAISDISYFPFFISNYEFEEFMVEFGLWYGKGELTAAFVGIRTDESLNRFRTIASKNKEKFQNKCFTTLVKDNLYNIYPIYDWEVSDLWHYHYLNPSLEYNKIYDYMFKAGLTPAQMRLCQPYGDDQKKGLWLYHILEPQTWYKVVSRVNGANSGALYAEESGNITGNRKITKPINHTWKSFSNLLLQSLPEKTRFHFISKFKVYLKWWRNRGYPKGIPDEAPSILESKRIAPSWRRIAKVLLKNDYWCKGLAFSQPKSEAYGQYLSIKKDRDERIKRNLEGKE